MRKKHFNQFPWVKYFCSLILCAALILSLGTAAHAETTSDTTTFPAVLEYTTTGGEFSLNEASRLVVISNSESLQNETLENDLKLLSSEFTAVGLTTEPMNIIFGSAGTAVAGDIAIELNAASDDISPEAYTIEIGETAKVSSTGEAGIFYGIRTIQKALLLNNGKMDCGTINDEPAVEVRGFHLDAARKYFTKDWIIAQIKDLSYQNFNTLQFHFSENEGYRLESSTLEAIDGWRYPSNGYLTKADMLDIIAECQKYHIELVPSLDSPGHMSYVLGFLPNDWDCSSIWSEYTDYRSVQTFNIFEKQECKDFLKTLFAEYAEFFSEAGCKHFNIGGDEFLNQFGRMTNAQYIQVMNYFNEISALVKEYGMTARAWNDGLMYGDYTGYTLDPDIEICYWAGPAGTATVKKFTDNGNKVINMADSMMYYVLGSWWMSAANPAGDRVFRDWDPGKLPSSADHGAQTMDYPYDDSLLGASFAVWCDTPSMLTEGQIATNIFMRTRATAQKCWNPTATLTYSELESRCNTLNRAPGYDGAALPAPGEVLYEGEFGTLTLRYVDTEGNTLRNDYTVYGLIDEQYTITPEKLYGYRFVSMDKDAEGIYTAEEIIVTLTYELYTDKAELQAAVDRAIREDDCIPGTYDAYGEALEAAKVLLADKSATQEAVDAALRTLTDAKKQAISLDRVELYLAVTYPVQPAGYTSASYANYNTALTAARTVLNQPDASAEEVAAALQNILLKKAALAVPTDLVSVSANKGTYSGWAGNTYGSWPLSNILDGNASTKAWIDGAQTVGDWFLFTFAKPVALNTFNIQFADGEDYIYQANVEVSADNSDWKEIGKIDNTTNPQYDMSFSANGETVQYVKITITKNVINWTQITEASFDYVLDETLDTSALETVIEEANGLDKSDYTVASWTVLEAALANAEAVLVETGVTAGEINAAVTALNASIESLQSAPETEPKEKVTEIFVDVMEGAWYVDSVQYVYDEGIIIGDGNVFAPDDATTRAMVAVILYRLSGSPEVTDYTRYNQFKDLPAVELDIWYTDAVAWALNEGVSTGDDVNMLYNPTAAVTREQLALFLWRYAKYTGKDVTVTATEEELFGGTYVSEWAKEGFAWAVENGIIKGAEVTDGTGTIYYELNPQGGATRAQLARMLHRYLGGATE